MMRKISILLVCLLFFLLVSGCSGTATGSPTTTPPPTPTQPVLSPSPVQSTSSQPTSTPKATITPTAAQPARPTATITPLVLPDANPLNEWNGIPIISEALAGQEVNHGYLFTIQLAVRKVQRFYSDILPSLGWEVQATGTKEGALVIAHKEGQILSIAISLHESGITVVRISLE
jgi:hypothetical protein